MDANIVDLRTLFGKPVSYRIPSIPAPLRMETRRAMGTPLERCSTYRFPMLGYQCEEASTLHGGHCSSRNRNNTINEDGRRRDGWWLTDNSV